MGRPRSAARRSFPDGLYVNTKGYFYWVDPFDGKSYGLGVDRASAFADARAANAKRSAEQSRSLVDRISASGVPTLRAWFDDWIARVGLTLAAKTIKNHQSAMRELLATCGHIPMCDITTTMIADVLRTYADSGRVRMAELIRATAQEVFRAAEVHGHIKAGASPVTATATQKSKVARMRLTLEDFLKIHAAQKKPWAKRSMELALVSAQRRGDVAAMQRAHIIDGHLQVDQRKSGGETMLGIPLSLRLDAVGWNLKDVIASCRSAGLLTPHLVHHRTGGGHYDAGAPVDVDTLSEAFAKARDLAEIPVEDGRTPATFHEIRSLAIRLYQAQYGQEFAQTLAGHKNLKTTLLYADPRNSEAKRIMVPDPRAEKVLNEF